ncbi:hypothetical protein MPSEU_000367200 [Mayamaea pseudoterrestris]|nr:hypothetical protein MPSEU_000367200 [Mayamaea pseudoterrestris]
MPTFAALDIDIKLRSGLLVSVSKLPKSDDDDDYHHHPVATPVALLSRHPSIIGHISDHTKDVMLLKLPQMKKLRHDVALAISEHSRPGKRAKLVHRHAQVIATDATSQYSARQASRIWIPGTVSALEAITYQNQKNYNNNAISTNCPALDQLLSSPFEHQSDQLGNTPLLNEKSTFGLGVPFGYVTQFCGKPACGKTQLCLQLAANALTQTTTYYLSSLGAVSCLANRLSTLARSRGKSDKSLRYIAALQSTHFVTLSASNAYSVLRVLHQIESTFMSSQETQKRSSDGDVALPVLIILDSASGCLSGAGTNLLATVGITLKRMARQHSMAIVLTNGTTQERIPQLNVSAGRGAPMAIPFLRDWKPALGQAWIRVADIHIRLERQHNPHTPQPRGPITNEATLIEATMERHVGSKPFGSAVFRVDNINGIVPAAL